MIGVIQAFVYPNAWSDHLLWASTLLLVLTRGPGRLSLLDHVIRTASGSMAPVIMTFTGCYVSVASSDPCGRRRLIGPFIERAESVSPLLRWERRHKFERRIRRIRRNRGRRLSASFQWQRVRNAGM